MYVCWILLFCRCPMFIVWMGFTIIWCAISCFSSCLLLSIMESWIFVFPLVHSGCCHWGSLCATGFFSPLRTEYPVQHLPLTMDFPSHVNCIPVHVKLATMMRSSSNEVSVLQTLISSLLQVANTSEYSLWTGNKLLTYEIKHVTKFLDKYVQYILHVLFRTFFTYIAGVKYCLRSVKGDYISHKDHLKWTQFITMLNQGCSQATAVPWCPATFSKDTDEQHEVVTACLPSELWYGSLSPFKCVHFMNLQSFSSAFESVATVMWWERLHIMNYAQFFQPRTA
jgi:hypothetical protein